MAGRLTRKSGVFVEKFSQLRLVKAADFGTFHCAVFKQHQCRNTTDTVFWWCIRVLVDVHLDDLDLAGIARGYIFEHRTNRLTGPTPFRPIVHQDWRTGIKYLFFESRIANMCNMVAQELLLSRFVIDANGWRV